MLDFMMVMIATERHGEGLTVLECRLCNPSGCYLAPATADCLTWNHRVVPREDVGTCRLSPGSAADQLSDPK